MSVFFIFGLYRGVWRYVSIADMLTIFKVVSIGSVASILFLTFVFRFQEYSRAVFFLDWILMLFLVSGTRIAFRVLGEFFSQAREKGSNILVFGAGDTGEMVIREIKRNKELNYNPIGFIDDNLGKIGSKIQGVTVLGSRDDLKGLVEEYGIKEILIAIPSLDIAELAEIAKVCRDCGISYRKIKGILDSEARDEFSKN
jgi:UDP-GlcNAc:undecaprenyl-phosphate GlcNAc-1-phosphate transferase